MALSPCEAGNCAQEGWAAVLYHTVMPEPSSGGAWADMGVETPEWNADAV